MPGVLVIFVTHQSLDRWCLANEVGKYIKPYSAANCLSAVSGRCIAGGWSRHDDGSAEGTGVPN